MRDIYDEWIENDHPLPEIKECPFCGSQGILCDDSIWKPLYGSNGAYVDMDIRSGDCFWVECDNCEARGGFGEIPEEAIKKWNKRARK